MRPALVDTDILSMFLRGHPQMVTRFEAYLTEYDQINFSIITYYEIVSGLKHRDAQKQLTSFLELSSHNTIVPLTVGSVEGTGFRALSLRRCSLVRWRRPFQETYVALATSRSGARWLAQAGVGISAALPEAGQLLIVAGNMLKACHPM